MRDRRTLAESLLARTVGPIRADAIYGDLLELAATRGRTWFWVALARTIVALTWRAPFAFACGVFVTFGIREYLFRIWRYIRPENLRMVPSWLHLAGPLLASTALPLWFLLTYALVRYGRHDSFARLTGALTLTMTFTFLYVPGVSLGFGVLGILIAASAMLHPQWRRPMLVLSAAVATGYVGLTCAMALRAAIPFLAHFERPLPFTIFRLTLVAVFAVEACMCSKMYDALLRPSAEPGSIPVA